MIKPPIHGRSRIGKHLEGILGRVAVAFSLVVIGFAALGFSACQKEDSSTGMWVDVKSTQNSLEVRKASQPRNINSLNLPKLPARKNLETSSLVDTDLTYEGSRTPEKTPLDTAENSFWNPNPKPYIPYQKPVTPSVTNFPTAGGGGAEVLTQNPQFVSEGKGGGTDGLGGGVTSRKGSQATGAQASLTGSSGSSGTPAFPKKMAPDSTAANPSVTNQTTAKPNNVDSGNSEPSGETRVASLNLKSESQAGLSPEGTVGSSVAVGILPGFDAVNFTFSGQVQPIDFQSLSPKSLEFNTWYLSGAEKQYTNTATIRYLHWQIHEAEAGNQIPSHPDCKHETLKDGKIKVTCQGPLPMPEGSILRLVTCGIPDMNVIGEALKREDRKRETQGRKPLGNVENPLAAFIDLVWKGEDDYYLDLEVCPERRYVDYPFYGPKLQIDFLLEVNKVAFFVQPPKDYWSHLDTYGAPVPNPLGIHNKTYSTNRLMGEFLKKGRIIQVIQALPVPTIFGQTIPVPDSINYLYTSPPSADGGEIVEGMPGNVICQQLENWDPSWVKQEVELFKLLNSQRAQGGKCGAKGDFDPVPPLNMNPTLRCAARFHSQDMAMQNYFSHTNLWGQTEGVRIFLAGTLPILPGGMEGTWFSEAGENILEGLSDPQSVLQEWLESEEHCANLFHNRFNYVGIGFHPGGTSGQKWTVDLGTGWD